MTKFNIILPSAAAEVLPPVGPLSSCTLKGEHPDAEGITLMAEIPLMLCSSVSLTHIQAEILWPVILVVRDSSFRWEELVLKGERVSSYSVVLREVPLSAPQRLRDRNSDTQTHHNTEMYTLSLLRM